MPPVSAARAQAAGTFLQHRSARLPPGATLAVMAPAPSDPMDCPQACTPGRAGATSKRGVSVGDGKGQDFLGGPGAVFFGLTARLGPILGRIPADLPSSASAAERVLHGILAPELARRRQRRTRHKEVCERGDGIRDPSMGSSAASAASSHLSTAPLPSTTPVFVHVSWIGQVYPPLAAQRSPIAQPRNMSAGSAASPPWDPDRSHRWVGGKCFGPGRAPRAGRSHR